MVRKIKNFKLKEHVYFVKGMHCASCEILIEKRLLKEKGIEAVEAVVNKGEVRIEHFGSRPSVKRLNSVFGKDNYTFSDKQIGGQDSKRLFKLDKQGQLIINKEKFYNFLIIGVISLVVVLGFLVLSRSGFAALISVNSQSTLPVFLLFGMLAGFSTCSALIGGIILSMSKQWQELYQSEDSIWQKFRPHLLFNGGRLVSYVLLGTVLGIIGGALQISLTFTSVLTLGVSVMMIFLALQMLGAAALRRFQFTMPKLVTRFVADENNFKGQGMPFLMGAFTFFLPCGFTITAQGLALISGSPLQAGLIMLFFALGTLPALLLIGFSSVKFTQKPHLAERFLKVAGVLVLFFAVYNINAQLNVLGFKSLSDLRFNSSEAVALKDGFPPVVGGKQVVKMEALAFGYEPSNIRVKAGIPVRWEIADKGTSGCTNAIVSRGLFEGQIDLIPGKTSVKEFVPTDPGRYKFSCWMGMVSGVIEVVASSAGSGQAASAEVIDSGAQGCGGGGGEGIGCGGGCGGGCGNSGCPYARQK